ncbi:unnamed protein product [Urochloa humidicola]
MAATTPAPPSPTAAATRDPVLGYRSAWIWRRGSAAGRGVGDSARPRPATASPSVPAAVCRALRRREARVLGRRGLPEPAHGTRSRRSCCCGHNSVRVPRRGSVPLSASVPGRGARQRRRIRAARAQRPAEAPDPCGAGSTHGEDAGSERRPTTKLEAGLRTGPRLPHPDLAIAGSRRAGPRSNPAPEAWWQACGGEAAVALRRGAAMARRVNRRQTARRGSGQPPMEHDEDGEGTDGSIPSCLRRQEYRMNSCFWL